MTRICIIMGKKTMTGNNVSHAKNRTKRAFQVNLHPHLFRTSNGLKVKLRLSSKGLRTVDKYGIEELLKMSENLTKNKH